MIELNKSNIDKYITPERQKYYKDLFNHNIQDVDVLYKNVIEIYKEASTKGGNVWFLHLMIRDKLSNNIRLEPFPLFLPNEDIKKIALLTKSYIKFLKEDKEFNQKSILEGVIYGIQGTGLVIKAEQGQEFKNDDIREIIKERGIIPGRLEEQKESKDVIMFNCETKYEQKITGFEYIESDDKQSRVVSDVPFMNETIEYDQFLDKSSNTGFLFTEARKNNNNK